MFAPIISRLRRWHLRSTTRRKLALLDDRLLADIGAKRSTISDFIAAQPEDGC